MTETKMRLAQILSQVRERQREYEMFAEAPASSGQIELLRHAAKAKLGNDLPEDYTAFLEQSDGLDWNGAVIYGAERKAETPDRPFLEGLLEATLALRDNEALHDLLVLGESGMIRRFLH